MDDTKGPVSRRAFLRRAGAKALTTGASIVPGLAAANAALKAGAQQKDSGKEDTAVDAERPEDAGAKESGEGTEAKDSR